MHTKTYPAPGLKPMLAALLNASDA